MVRAQPTRCSIASTLIPCLHRSCSSNREQSRIGPYTKPIDAALTSLVAGQRLGFRLRANPTRSVPAEPRDAHGARSRGERRPIRDEDSQRVWLKRLGDRHGFNLPLDGSGQPVVGVAADPPLVGWRGKRRLTITACTFDGTLEVAEAARFLVAVREGVGRARAYGCGLLSLRPA
jgi:CRISPR system Cascade subunit CasE